MRFDDERPLVLASARIGIRAIEWIPSSSGRAASRQVDIHAIEWKTGGGDASVALVARKSTRSHGKDRAPPPWILALAEAVRARRKALNLTQQQLADLAGCGPVLVYAIEKGKTTVRFDKLVDVLHVLGLQLRLESGKARVAVRGREE